MKKVFNGGSLDKFRDFFENAKTSDESFRVVSNGMSRKVIFPNGTKFRFFGGENTKFIEGVWITNMVKKEIDKFIEKNGLPELKPKVDVQLFNFNAIRNLINEPKAKPCYGIDIDRCYWRTANLLGYISDELYERGLNKSKKMGLLVAIGCLNKMPIVKDFENGVCVRTFVDKETNERYSPFYWNIIYHTYQLMIDAYEQFGDDFLMYLTDCLFVRPDKVKDAQKFFSNRGYQTKKHIIDFISYDGMRLTWFDTKENKKKQMYAMNRDISLEYSSYKISKGQLNNQPFA